MSEQMHHSEMDDYHNSSMSHSEILQKPPKRSNAYQSKSCNKQKVVLCTFFCFSDVLNLLGFLCGYIRRVACEADKVLKHKKLGGMGKKGRVTAQYRRLAALGCHGNNGGGDRAMPKGYVPMLVGSGSERVKVLVHKKHFGYPQFGYEQERILKTPFALDCFKRLVEQMSENK